VIVPVVVFATDPISSVELAEIVIWVSLSLLGESTSLVAICASAPFVSDNVFSSPMSISEAFSTAPESVSVDDVP
jgi:hypothetical protein